MNKLKPVYNEIVKIFEQVESQKPVGVQLTESYYRDLAKEFDKVIDHEYSEGRTATIGMYTIGIGSININVSLLGHNGKNKIVFRNGKNIKIFTNKPANDSTDL